MKRLFSLLMILAMASALTVVVETASGDVVLSSPNIAAKVNIANNRLDIAGVLTVPMFPTIKSKGQPVPVSIPQVTGTAVGGKTNTYIVNYPENFAEDIFGSASVEVNDDYVEQVISLENSGDKQLTVEVEVLPTIKGSYYVYAPYKRSPNADYLWVSPQLAEERAEGVVITFATGRPTFDQPQEINLKQNFVRMLAWTVTLEEGEKKSIVIKYSPGYVNDEDLLKDSPYSPPYSNQYILHTQSDALFEISGESATDALRPAIGETATGMDALQLFKQTMDSIADTPTSESTLATLEVDLEDVVGRLGTGLNSVEKALMFREMARRQGLPAEARVGYKEGNYYAWVVAYAGTTAFTYDPAGKSSEYTQVYREPEPANCRGEMHECPWSAGIQEGLFCIGPFCLPGIMLIAMFALVFVAVFALFQYKTDFIYQVMGMKKGVSMLKKDTLDGTYTIISDNYLPKDPLEKAVWDALRRRSGGFKAEDYVTETGFSEVLVKAAIEKFAEKGLIRKSYG
ncbi:MAG: hypothetical protein KAW41_05835 [Candidatus Diapherotrites archaeon]|nr:hypothetical protein [Candidatus Diapherotrites archaeon]